MWVSYDVYAYEAMDCDVAVVNSVDGCEVAGECAAGSSYGVGSSSGGCSDDLAAAAAGEAV